MINIVIVEDKLDSARDIARQFGELAAEHQELDIQVKAICLFYEDSRGMEEKSKAMEELTGDGLTNEVKLVSLYDFDDVMDAYMQNQEEPTIAIMDFLLEHAANCGARGIPMRRVNIRYTRRLEKRLRDRVWFYTTGGEDNIRILEDLFGQEHVLRVKVREKRLFLDINHPSFLTALQGNQGTVLQTV